MSIPTALTVTDDVDFLARYEPEPWEETSEAVVRAAEAAGARPDDAETVLADVVNGDALDRLFEPTNGQDGAVVVEVWGLVFVVTPGDIEVYDP